MPNNYRIDRIGDAPVRNKKQTVIMLILLDKFAQKNGGDEACSSFASGLSVRKSGRPVSIQGDRPEAGAEPANDGSGELRIFLPKNRIVC